MSGSGRLALTPEMDAEMTLRFTDTSLDPYIRFFAAEAVAVHDRGRRRHHPRRRRAGGHRSLRRRDDGRRAELKLFDYPVRNDGPDPARARTSTSLEVKRFRLVGEGTALELSGNVDAARQPDRARGVGRRQPRHPAGVLPRHPQLGERLAARADSGARSTRRCSPATRRSPTAGSATSALPHSLQAINGGSSFDAQGIRIDDMTGAARRRPGAVRRPHRRSTGYGIGELDLTATGEQMHLRYPEGFRSTIDATLTLRGNLVVARARAAP